MDMRYEIFYHEQVVSLDILSLSSSMKNRIRSAIEQKLTEHPEIFGKPLRRSLKNYRKLRVGDYRIIFRIEGKNIKILIIAHRSFVYENVLQRSETF